MDLEEIEFRTWQYKEEKNRPADWSEHLREAPIFEPLPKLADRLVEARQQLEA